MLRLSTATRAVHANLVAVSLLLCAPSVAAVYEVQADGRIIDREIACPRKAATRHAVVRRSSASAPVVPKDLEAAFTGSAGAFDLSADLVEAVAWAESRFRVSARSPTGAYGVMQLMPATARALGVDRHDVRQNVAGGTSYLRQLLNRYQGDTIKALAAYNAGPDAVDRHSGIPPFPETQHYVARILDRLARLGAMQESQP